MGVAVAETGPPPHWTEERISPRRRWRNRQLWALSALGLVALVTPIVWILAGVIAQAVKVWHWSVLTHTTTGSAGLSNAIVGTLALMAGVLVLAGSVGIGFGIYIAEMAPPRLAVVLRSASEVLSGVPSIVIGYVGYVALVVGLHWGFSLLAGYLALSVLVVPYVAKSTELAISQVPLAYREGGEALGMSEGAVLRRVVLRSAIPGISTGLIVALAISVGETAPLLYTVGYSDGYPNGHLLHSQVGYLTYVAYQFWDQASPKSQALSHEAALVLVVLVLLLILAGRLIVRLTQRFAPGR
jgi:phosphate transport system permease protein